MLVMMFSCSMKKNRKTFLTENVCPVLLGGSGPGDCGGRPLLCEQVGVGDQVPDGGLQHGWVHGEGRREGGGPQDQDLLVDHGDGLLGRPNPVGVNKLLEELGVDWHRGGLVAELLQGHPEEGGCRPVHGVDVSHDGCIIVECPQAILKCQR